ncbi:MAG: hypothetical protein AAFO07_27095 [Bacteroidota bacterium]
MSSSYLLGKLLIMTSKEYRESLGYIPEERTLLTRNWEPPSFQEFWIEAKNGKIGLNIMQDHYFWLYSNVLPKKKGLFAPKMPYHERLLEKMMSSEDIFWKVYHHQIDLVLYY